MLSKDTCHGGMDSIVNDRDVRCEKFAVTKA